MQIIYIDMLFFLNIIMNFLILKIATVIMREKVTILRLFIAASISALVYCIGIIIPQLKQIPMSIYQCFIPVGAVIYIFKCYNIIVFLKKIIVVNGVAWIIGGIAFNIYYTTAGYINQSKMNIIVPITSGIIIWILVEVGYKAIRQNLVEPRYAYDVVLKTKNKEKEITAYLDTGNMLYTIKHEPVMLVEYEQVIDIISQEYKEVLKICKEEIIIEDLLQYQKKLKLYLIPFTSVGCKESILLGIPIECVVFYRGKIKHVVENMVIGICYQPLFKDGRYNALMHPDMIQQ